MINVRIPLSPPFDKGGLFETTIALPSEGGLKGDVYRLKINPPVSPFDRRGTKGDVNRLIMRD